MELLIKAADTNAPSLSEWKDNLNNVILPQAEAFFTRWPEAENVKTKIAEARAAESAQSLLSAASAGKQINGKAIAVEDQTKAASTLLSYVPPTALEKSRIEIYNTPTNPDTMLPLALGEKVQHEGYPILVHHDYYKNQVEVESLKFDAVKQAELDEQDRMLPKRGDIIGVEEDSCKWGSIELSPLFIIVKVSNLKAADYKYLTSPLMQDTDDESMPMSKAVHTKHQYALNIDMLESLEEIREGDFQSRLIDKAKVLGDLGIKHIEKPIGV
jgi:hypothetical protein